MQYLAILLATIGLVSAQAKPNCVALANAVPPFAKQCIDASAGKAGCKGGASDLVCLCSKTAQIQVDALPCVQKQPGVDLPGLINQAKAICDCQGK